MDSLLHTCEQNKANDHIIKTHCRLGQSQALSAFLPHYHNNISGLSSLQGRVYVYGSR